MSVVIPSHLVPNRLPQHASTQSVCAPHLPPKASAELTRRPLANTFWPRTAEGRLGLVLKSHTVYGSVGLCGL
jgi:hypothetical protein